MGFDKRISKVETMIGRHKPIGETVRIIFSDDPGFAEKGGKDDTACLWNGQKPDGITIHFRRPRPEENA
jgi:hypothetical protein